MIRIRVELGLNSYLFMASPSCPSALTPLASLLSWVRPCFLLLSSPSPSFLADVRGSGRVAWRIVFPTSRPISPRRALLVTPQVMSRSFSFRQSKGIGGVNRKPHPRLFDRPSVNEFGGFFFLFLLAPVLTPPPPPPCRLALLSLIRFPTELPTFAELAALSCLLPAGSMFLAFLAGSRTVKIGS